MVGLYSGFNLMAILTRTMIGTGSSPGGRAVALGLCLLFIGIPLGGAIIWWVRRRHRDLPQSRATRIYCLVSKLVLTLVWLPSGLIVAGAVFRLRINRHLPVLPNQSSLPQSKNATLRRTPHSTWPRKSSPPAVPWKANANR